MALVINVKTGNGVLLGNKGEQERCRVGKPNFKRANDLSLIKCHLYIYIYIYIYIPTWYAFLKNVSHKN